MTETLAVLILIAFFLAPGLALLLFAGPLEKKLRAFPRSMAASTVLYGAGLALFLYKIGTLSEADQIIDKQIMLVIFSAMGLLAFHYAPDFLGIRGLAILLLVFANEGLKAVWMVYDAPAYALKIGLYLLILLALYLGAVPYRLRDFIQWLYEQPKRSRQIGSLFIALAAAVGGCQLL